MLLSYAEQNRRGPPRGKRSPRRVRCETLTFTTDWEVRFSNDREFETLRCLVSSVFRIENSTDNRFT